jgi:hypothetical protein
MTVSEHESIGTGPSTERGAGPHITDEELLLDYYSESPSSDRDSRRAHLEACEACRALDREMRAVLALIDTAPAVEAPAGFGREMWARVEPHISARAARSRSPWSLVTLRHWALAGGMAALLLASFTLGRVWERAPHRQDSAPVAAGVTSVANGGANSRTARLLSAEMEDHLERSQRVLVDLVNADDAADVSLASDRTRAADLVADGRLYRRAADRVGDVEMRDLLEDVERVLVDVANGSSGPASKELKDVRTRIDEQDLVFRLRVAGSEIRERQRRAQPTY